MDEKDIQILKSLEELETTSTEAASDATGIPLSTIHYRLNNLRDAGVITNERLDLDLDEFGLGVTILVQIFTKDDQSHTESGQAIAGIEGVTKVFFTMGSTDFIALARLPNSDSVERLISDFEALDEVARTDSTFVIERELDSHYPLQQYSEETLVEEVGE
ncbi:Lrp/AsnC family transcriptional regulator [Halobacterium salinarum]|uniref:Lrp/AsnC family transcriptional regulator n=1 Tax=Halobacterium salinarum TaxID=2242 RepID=UPI002557235A|nr:Lrp/AsnC family transcriptional regulator [Halobacterium salinarum]MDL0122706.1 Lrp/AsnC family transcriptional regulator [Halobacterium salinarum]MDL0133870.1 Lrp/AsnC family transcriptional regulator [Halobacterium salinarum]